MIAGPALNQLTTSEQSLSINRPVPGCEFGIIAGKYDKKVPPEFTKLPNMSDFLTVARTHTFIMNAKEVQVAVLNFLETGKF